MDLAPKRRREACRNSVGGQFGEPYKLRYPLFESKQLGGTNAEWCSFAADSATRAERA